NLAYNYIATRDYETAEKTLDRGIEVAPNAFGLRASKAKLALDARGDFSVAEKLLAMAPKNVDPEGMVTFGRMSILILQRKYPEALAVLNNIPNDMVHMDGTSPMPKSLLEGN